MLEINKPQGAGGLIEGLWYVICLPMEHQGVHKNSIKNAHAIQDRIGTWQCWFLRRGKIWNIRSGISGQLSALNRGRTTLIK